jgi:hypothetical protein
MQPDQSTPPTVLRFRSASGRTEIAQRSDGTAGVHVLTGADVLTADDIAKAAWALRTITQDGACAVDLDEAIAERLRDPEFALAWMRAHIGEAERREREAFERGRRAAGTADHPEDGMR